MEDSQPAQMNGRSVKKNMNSNTSVMYIRVTDRETKKCVDPGENGAILDAGGGGGPCPPGGGENRQLASDSEGS
jgi:hypothetical protein